MNGRSSAAQIFAIFRAIRLTNAGDSITQGPRMNAGVFPPKVTGPIVRGLTFTSAPVSRIIFLKSKVKAKAERPSIISYIVRFDSTTARPCAIPVTFMHMKRNPDLIGLPSDVSAEEAAAQFDALQKKLVPLWRSIERFNQDEQSIIVVPQSRSRWQ